MPHATDASARGSLVLGTLNVSVFFALLFVAGHRLPGGVAATLGAVQPLLSAGLAALLLAERIRRRTLLARAMGMVGVALLVLPADAADALHRGPAAGADRRGRGRPRLARRGGVALAYALWFRGVEALPVQQVSLLGPCSPLVATAVGWLVLHQSLAAGQIAGAILVLTALRIGHSGASARRLRRRRQADLPSIDALPSLVTFPSSGEAGRVATRPGGPAAGTLRP